MKVKVVRAFCINAKRKEPGSVVELPEHIAREAIHLGKAVRVEEAPAVEKQPMTSKSTPALTGGKKAGD